MNESKAGNKVRRHKAAVDFLEVAVASEKLGNVPLVPEFPSQDAVRIELAWGKPYLIRRGRFLRGSPGRYET